MSAYSLTLARHIDELASLREDMRALAQEAERHRRAILGAGGGRSKRWIATVCHVPPYVQHMANGCTQVRLTPVKKPEKR